MMVITVFSHYQEKFNTSEAVRGHMVLRREVEAQKAERDVPKSSHSSEFALFKTYLKIANNLLNTPSH